MASLPDTIFADIKILLKENQWLRIRYAVWMWDPAKAAGTSIYKGETIYFCNVNCKKKFDAEPEKYITEIKEDTAIDPICGMTVSKASPKGGPPSTMVRPTTSATLSAKISLMQIPKQPCIQRKRS